jgi:exosortase A-associated hydrolase 1
MHFEERAVTFPCGGEPLYGVLALPAQPGRRGVLVVVGGPQYRAGSHRQFVLLARALAAAGIPVMRFDYRGMGDSGGAQRGFDSVGEDLDAAIGQFMASVPGMDEVVLWGLCDGASAAAIYAPGDARVSGLVLLNPWVRTPEGEARATLKHYYRGRLLDRGLWTKIAQGRFELRAAAQSLAGLVAKTVAPRPPAAAGKTLPEKMYDGLSAFDGRLLVITSGADLTAQEFADLAGSTPAWRALMAAPRVTTRKLAPADHTFSRRGWRDQVALWTGDWVSSW